MTPATSAQAITPSAPPSGEEVPAYVLELERADMHGLFVPKKGTAL